MENHQRYLAEEVVYDHADGLLSRREALRRLSLMGFTAVGASALLAACGAGDGDEEEETSLAPPSSAPPNPSTTAAAATEAVTYPGRTSTLMGAYARATAPRGAVVVVHENRGLTDHIRSVAGRLAASGYSAATPGGEARDHRVLLRGHGRLERVEPGRVPTGRGGAVLRAGAREPGLLPVESGGAGRLCRARRQGERHP